MEYDELLKRGLEKITKIDKGRRFVMPEAVVEPQGSRTIITNFTDIASKFIREPSHLLKYLQKELATSGFLQGAQAVLVGNITPTLINKKLKDYADEFVFCKVCGQPDTKLVKEHRIALLRCEACGARRSVKQL